MSDKPTGVFVRLPLSEEQIVSISGWIPGSREELRNEVLPSIFSIIGTPVADGELAVVTTLGTLRDPIPLVRQSEAQAQIAARDAEIVRLREALDRIRLVPFPMMDLPAGIMHGIAHKSLKDGAA